MSQVQSNEIQVASNQKCFSSELKNKKNKNKCTVYTLYNIYMNNIYCQKYIQNITGWKYTDEIYMNLVIYHGIDGWSMYMSAGRY